MTAKRKNPLQNLDQFLKKEASSLVNPKNISKEDTGAKKHSSPLTEEELIAAINELALKNNVSLREQLIKIIKKIMEKDGLKESKDKLVMNTLLYLEGEENWKDRIKSYWEQYPQ